MRVFSLQCLIDGRIKLVRISRCIKIHYVSVIKNWIKMDFTFANVFSYPLPKQMISWKNHDIKKKVKNLQRYESLFISLKYKYE